MSFFRQFSMRWYDFDGDTRLITNLLHQVGIIINEQNTQSVDTYYIQDDDTLYSISNDHYGHPDYWWIIALINNTFNGINKWPISEKALEKNINERYMTMNAKEMIKHYEKPNMTPTTLPSMRFFYQLDEQWTDLMIIQRFDLKAISVYEWERRENEKKRYITLPKASLIQQIEREFNDMMIQRAKSFN